jgi:hypothetical protein
MAYRLYYRGDHLDASFPAAVPPREIVVPAEKPKPDTAPYYIQMNSKKSGASSGALTPGLDQDDGDEPLLDVAALIGDSNPVEERRKVLKEVRGER